MKKTKMEKGITLIALIITIVVLLILAMVTIGTIKNSSIIENSKKASDDYTKAQEKEQLELALSEWQIQKNIPGNTQTFKEMLESSLGKNAKVSENGNELTVKFDKTGNTYNVSQDGTIEELAKLEGTDLEKYIFGDNMQGRNLTEIMELDVNNGIDFNDNIQFKDSTYATVINYAINDIEDGVGSYIVYIKHDNEVYKFKMDASYEEQYLYKSNVNYGLIKIEVDTENTKIGKTVSYDGKTWTILYNDSTNGLQMICNKLYKYKYSENNYDEVFIGYDDYDPQIINWNDKNVIKEADLNKNDKLEDFEKALYSYNHCIEILNSSCENLFKKNETDENYKDSNIIDVRCVGSNLTNKNAENAIPYTSKNLSKWPENDSNYAIGVVDGKVKDIDKNFVTDFDRMVALGIVEAFGETQDDYEYWMASRLGAFENEDEVDFEVRKVWGLNLVMNDSYFLEVKKSSVYGSSTEGGLLRPIIILKSDVQFSGSGTEADPYTFAE